MISRNIVYLCALGAILTGCGPRGTTPSLTLTLTNSGVPVTSITSGTPATVKATLKDSTGAAVTGAVVTFSTDTTLATITPSATALTDSTGVATVTLSPATVTATGAATITATSQVGTSALTGTIGYSVGGAVVTVTNPVFGVNPLAAFGTTSVAVTVNVGGVPVTTPQPVTFSSPCASSGKAVLSTGVSTINGVATASYRDNGCAGTDTITASVSGLASSSATLNITVPSLTITLTNGGVPVTSITSGTPATVKATLKDSTGAAVTGAVVTFSTDTTLATITPSATALTDSTGVATVTLSPATVTATGATTITASSQDGTSALTGTIGYSVDAPARVASSLTITLINSGVPVTSITSGTPATVKATLKDTTGAAVAGAVVTFSTDTTLATITPAATALTDSAGVATATLSPATVTAAGATTITATSQIGTTALTGTIGYSVGGAIVTITNPAFGVSPLSAFGTTSVAVTVSSGGVPVTTPQTVTFSSPCASSGKAVLSASVVTVSGIATGSYRDNGCAGTDTVTASVSGITSSSATLTITAPTTGSLQYVSAIPANISLKGSGGTSTSQVTFKVLDANGNPLSGKTVTFGLSTTIGGLSLASPTDISKPDGLVVATVNSGTVSTPVRVTASTPGATAGSTLTTQSSQLSITTGIPDQAGFTVSATKLNFEGLTTDGVTTILTARLADHFKNPVPDGTTVNFTAEAGSVVGTCNTVAGACSSTYTTQGTRPLDGRVTVLAYAVGEETFTDLNGNGLADLAPVNEMIDANGVSTDLPEAWVDYNENGLRDANEPFLDFNNDGLYTPADGKFEGVLCDNTTAPPAGSSANTCATAKTLHVRSQVVLVLSDTKAVITTTPASITLSACNATPETVSFLIVDKNGNPMPAGTTIAVATNKGEFVGPTSFIEPNSSVKPIGQNYSVSIQRLFSLGACTEPTPSSGKLTITVTTPGGVVTTQQVTVTN